MITTNKIQEAAVAALGGSAHVSECTDYNAGPAEPSQYEGIRISTHEYVIKIFHKKYKTRSREFAHDLLRALLPEAMRRTVEDALRIAENLERNKEIPDHVDADRYEAARKVLRR